MSSGTEVAKETTVIPITIFEILSLKEMPIEAFSSQSPPKMRSVKPIIMNKIFI
jgi:hypothetical protein